MKRAGFIFVTALLITVACTSISSVLTLESSPTPNLQATLVFSEFSDCIPKNTQLQLVKVLRVVDGDTIHVSLNGQDFLVRYIGMDTPEVNEPFGSESTGRNSQMVAGRYVMLVKDVSETDRYGRLLRYVLVDGVFVNYRLAALGYAHSATFPPDVACAGLFKEAEAEAREAKLGLWGQ